ncbi:MAG: hypothetical protein LUQ16_07875 [Methanomassiliicoccales archaeon]|nr:hypothetical protein [Methanomassiliicoccales archaeon]MDD1756343.1 hypothetical protein [Methanomassiliicoccales archaeon]
MSDQEKASGKSTESLDSFRNLVLKKIDHEEDMLRQLHRDPKRTRIGLVIVIFLLVVSFIALFVRPYGSYIWLLVSFIVVCFAWLLLFLPTTKREKGFWRSRREINKQKSGKTKSLKFIAKRRKRLIAEVWVNAFFYGNAIPTFAIIGIFSISIFFTLYHRYVLGDIGDRETWIIVIQCLAIIGLHSYIYLFKPYAKSMFSMPKDLKGRVGKARGTNALVAAAVTLLIVLFVAFFSLLIVVGLLLPGTTLDKVREFLTANGGANTYTLILVAAIQYVVFRFFQSVTSSRMGLKVVENQLGRLRNNVLTPLDDLVAQQAAGKPIDPEKLNGIKAEFYQVGINRMFRHDYFGKVPMFLINPDMKLLMREDVLEVLDKAGGTG